MLIVYGFLFSLGSPLCWGDVFAWACVLIWAFHVGLHLLYLCLVVFQFGAVVVCTQLWRCCFCVDLRLLVVCYVLLVELL